MVGLLLSLKLILIFHLRAQLDPRIPSEADAAAIAATILLSFCFPQLDYYNPGDVHKFFSIALGYTLTKNLATTTSLSGITYYSTLPPPHQSIDQLGIYFPNLSFSSSPAYSTLCT